MVHAVQKRLNINNHISIAAIDYIKKLFVYAFIVIRHVLSKCFACLLFEEAHEMARIREIEIIRHFTDSCGWRIAIRSSVPQADVVLSNG